MYFKIRRWAAVIGIFLAPSVYGLGLGELTVSSGLGQPLRASITLLGDETDLSPDCFRLQAAGNSLPLPADVQFSLEPKASGHMLLMLKTRMAINDPVGGFVLVVRCGGLLQKEYAFLLDPMQELERQQPIAPARLPAEIRATPAESRPRSESRRNSQASEAGPYATTIKKPRPKAKNNPPDLPRLVLSGTRKLAVANEGALALKLDLALPDPARARQTPLTSTELLDENTALNHKLDHLERQLSALQKRNAELLQRAQAAETLPGAPPKRQPATVPWPYFLLGLLSLSLAVAVVLYRRRAGRDRRFSRRTAHGEVTRPLVLPSLFPREKAGGEVQKAPAPPPNQDDDFLAQPAEGAEIHDTMKDEVEVFVAHGNTTLAIRLLENHVRQSPAESPVPWLLLLDLLQRENLVAEYEATRQQCKQYYNVEIPSLADMAAASGRPGIEAYPHVMAELVRLWPGDKAIPYLDDLLRDTRNGSRAGFNLAAYNEILLLRSIREKEATGAW